MNERKYPLVQLRCWIRNDHAHAFSLSLEEPTARSEDDQTPPVSGAASADMTTDARRVAATSRWLDGGSKPVR